MLLVMEIRLNVVARFFFALLLIGGFCGCEKSLPPAVIVGGSMAPQLLGEHLQCTCPDCRFAFASDPRARSSQLNLVCPNCGSDEISPNTSRLQPPLEFELSPARGAIERFDIVAFRFSDRPEFGVKRVLGLPGESIQFSAGDLLINGSRIAKQPHQILEQMVLVYDSRFTPAPTSDTQSRLIPDEAEADWRFENQRWTFRRREQRAESERQPQLSDSPLTGLRYQHFACYRQPQPLNSPSPVTDFLAYNQTLTEQLYPTDQLIAIWNLRCNSQARFSVNLGLAPSVCRIELNCQQSQAVIQTDARPAKSIDIETASDAVELAIAKVDGYWTIWLNRIVLFRTVCTSTSPDQPLVAENSSATEPVRKSAVTAAKPPTAFLTGADGQIELERFRLFRDVYYRYPEGESTIDRWQLSETEFFVAGDNQSVSIDSRHWQKPGLAKSQIIAKLKGIDLGTKD